MASQEDLAEVMQNALERNGDLALMRVQLEEKLASISSQSQYLSHGPELSPNTEISKPTMPTEVYLINELLREYLKTTGCEKTASVLVTESGLPAEPMSRHQLHKALAPGKKMDRNGYTAGIYLKWYWNLTICGEQ